MFFCFDRALAINLILPGRIQLLQYRIFFLLQVSMEQDSQLSIEQFESVRVLGEGSFARVTLVKKNGCNTLYALKTVKMNRLSQKDKDNALNQIRLLASFNIPTVIKYEGSFFNDSTNELCVLMEYADGGDLQHKIVNRQDQSSGEGFQEKFIWKVAYELLQGLKTLHKHSIIHRDIKSANVFFVKGVAKLGDLNVSKLAEDGFCTTKTGTPYYTSPQIWLEERYGNKCDIWSLGCLIYELCVLKVPFKATDLPSLYRKITKGKYQEIPAKYSSKLKRFISMCLTVEQEMRPSASQLLDNSMFHNIEFQFEDVRGGEVNMVDTIRCPKVLKFLNSRLPKAGQGGSKKVVTFTSKQLIEDQKSPSSKENIQIRKIRSEKVIQWNDEDNLKAPRPHLIKLPPMQKERESEKNISNGLCFSSKKLKMKPTSTKLIIDCQNQPQSFDRIRKSPKSHKFLF